MGSILDRTFWCLGRRRDVCVEACLDGYVEANAFPATRANGAAGEPPPCRGCPAGERLRRRFAEGRPFRNPFAPGPEPVGESASEAPDDPSPARIPTAPVPAGRAVRRSERTRLVRDFLVSRGDGWRFTPRDLLDGLRATHPDLRVFDDDWEAARHLGELHRFGGPLTLLVKGHGQRRPTVWRVRIAGYRLPKREEARRRRMAVEPGVGAFAIGA